MLLGSPHLILPVLPQREILLVPKSVDLEKLATAVALHETHDCTDTTGAALVHNAVGIMTWKDGHRHFKAYTTCAESKEDFKRLWAKSYHTFPTLALAERYTGTDRAETWLKNVTYFYRTL